jgi:hypothetical protein
MFNLVKLPRGNLFYPITIARALSFEKEILTFLSAAELEGLIEFLALHPERGEVIPGTGGVRKLRWGTGGKGKSKGLRIMYFYHDLNMPLFLLAVYSKGERMRMTKREEMTLAKMAEDLKANAARKAMGGTVQGSSAS